MMGKGVLARSANHVYATSGVAEEVGSADRGPPAGNCMLARRAIRPMPLVLNRGKLGEKKNVRCRKLIYPRLSTTSYQITKRF